MIQVSSLLIFNNFFQSLILKIICPKLWIWRKKCEAFTFLREFKLGRNVI